MSEQELVQKVLEFANWSGEDIWAFHDIDAALTTVAKNVRLARSAAIPDPDAVQRETEAGPETQRARLVGLRDCLRDDLTSIAANVRQYREKHAKKHLMLTGKLLEIPCPVVVNGKLEKKSRYLFADFLAAFDYALLLMVAKPFGDALCKCRSCGHFFLMQKTPGRARRRYCTEECMRTWHERDAKTRVYAWRKGLTAGKYRAQLEKARKHK